MIAASPSGGEFVQLIDLLVDRSDSVGIIDGTDGVTAEYNLGWNVVIEGVPYQITRSAFDNMLNELRIPIKYIERCVAANAIKLATDSVNFFLSSYGKLSFLVENLKGDDDVFPVITQVFPGKGLYIPAVKINDLIVDYLGFDCVVSDFSLKHDIFKATYLSASSVEICGETYDIGLMVLYSDCFAITPRFDGILRHSGGATLAWPTTGRKFRVASNTIPQVIYQIEEFIESSLTGLRDHLIPGLKSFQNDTLVDAEKWVGRLCSDLRLNQRVKNEIVAGVAKTRNHLPLELVLDTALFVGSENCTFDANVSRDIQVAVSNYVVTGEFK